MSQFIQLHILTSYPPANLNRDDLGRPKTAMMGGALRLRVSSQSLKRAWRTSEVFESALAGHLGTRTREIGVGVRSRLIEKGVSETKATEYAKKIAEVFGKLRKKKDTEKDETKKKAKEDHEPVEIEQLAHFSPEELNAINELVDKLAKEGRAPDDKELQLLRKDHSAADIAMFGRMLASEPGFNVEAAVQVAHAISIHKIAVEDDFFTAVDDLNAGESDMGAGHIGDTEFAAGLFYEYICVDRDLLDENLGGDLALADKAIRALVEAATSVAPKGKQNSFASRARASYVLAEKGSQQPRSLSVAFLSPVRGEQLLRDGISCIESNLQKMDNAYGDCADERATMDLNSGEGSLQAIIDLAVSRTP